MPEQNTDQHPMARMYLIIYISMLFFGIVETVKSVTLPAIKAQFGINYTETGGLISFAWFGYVALCFLVTLFLQRFGIKKSILSGCFLIIAGCTMTLFAPSFFMVMIALFLMSASFGFFEVGNNALAMKIFTKRTALLMSLMHFFYGLGAVIGPLIGAYIINHPQFAAYGENSWRYVYFVLVFPLVIVTAFVLITRFGSLNDVSHVPEPDANGKIEHLTFSNVLKRPIVWIFIFMLGFMEVVEFGAANWAPFYLKDVYGLSPEQEGALFVSTFYILFTISRLFGGFVAEKMGYYPFMLLCILMTIMIYAIGFSLGLQGIWILTLTGLFIAQFWILLLSLAEKRFKQEAAMVTSVIITLSGLINGIFQLIIGLTNEFIGNAWGYRSCLFYAIIILCIAVINKEKILDTEKKR